MATFTIRYYIDIAHHHQAQPCALSGRSYAAADEAEKVAREELASVRQLHGQTVGFAILEDNGRVASIGPGTNEDA